jgi:opacity protein-like surface antigen
MSKTFVLVFVLAASAVAQPIGFGVKGGWPLTDLFDSETQQAATSGSDYIFGPMVELRLPAGFAIEANALYSKVNFSSAGAAVGTFTDVLDSSAWEFPILLKYKFGGANAGVAAARPYVAAGANFRRIGDLANLTNFVTGSNPEDIDTNNTGFTFGAGIEFRALFIKISPELRFTHWGQDNFLGGAAQIFKTNRNQGQFLIGLNF